MHPGDNIPDNENGKYKVIEIHKFQLPPNKEYDLQLDFLDSTSRHSQNWAMDGMLIDEELLYAEDAEADRIYQELKARTSRRRSMEEKENRLSIAMKQHDEEYDEEDVEEEDIFEMGTKEREARNS